MEANGGGGEGGGSGGGGGGGIQTTGKGEGGGLADIPHRGRGGNSYKPSGLSSKNTRCSTIERARRSTSRTRWRSCAYGIRGKNSTTPWTPTWAVRRPGRKKRKSSGRTCSQSSATSREQTTSTDSSRGGTRADSIVICGRSGIEDRGLWWRRRPVTIVLGSFRGVGRFPLLG